MIKADRKSNPWKDIRPENIIKHNVHYYKQSTDPGAGLNSSLSDLCKGRPMFLFAHGFNETKISFKSKKCWRSTESYQQDKTGEKRKKVPHAMFEDDCM